MALKPRGSIAILPQVHFSKLDGECLCLAIREDFDRDGIRYFRKPVTRGHMIAASDPVLGAQLPQILDGYLG